MPLAVWEVQFWRFACLRLPIPHPIWQVIRIGRCIDGVDPTHRVTLKLLIAVAYHLAKNVRGDIAKPPPELKPSKGRH